MQRLKEQGLSHSLKAAAGTGKKRKKNTVDTQPVAAESSTIDLRPALVQSEGSVKVSPGNIRNEGTAALTAKVLTEQEDRQKKRRLGTNDNLKSLFTSNNGMHEKGTDFMTRGFSIPTNAKR